jgi:hypothetical protein
MRSRAATATVSCAAAVAGLISAPEPTVANGLVGFLDLPTFVGGHTYDTGASPLPESRGDGGGGGISTPWLVAALLLALFTVGVLVSLNPSGARAKLKTVGPAAAMVVVIVAPLVMWAASSGEGATESLIVERATARNGAPELIVYLGDKDLNTLKTTNGRRAVRLECLGRGGHVVLDAKQRWPFLEERGFDYPHIHQAASVRQLHRAARCRLRGTRVRLEADVEGILAS